MRSELSQGRTQSASIRVHLRFVFDSQLVRRSMSSAILLLATGRSRIHSRCFLVLEYAPCLSYRKPVSTTPPKEHSEGSSSGSVRDLAIKRILVPTDFSDSAAHALNYAIGLSRPYQAEIMVVHVFHLQEYLALLSEKAQVDRGTANEVLEAAKRRALEMLEELLRRFEDAQTVMIPILLFGVADEEIVKYAAEHEVDLIVIPTHARTGLAHIFLGSTAERVISHAPCPVVVVKRGEGKI